MQTDLVLDRVKQILRTKMTEYTEDLVLSGEAAKTVHLQERVKALRHAIELVDYAYKEAIKD